MRGTSLSAWHGCVSQSWRWGPAVWAESSSACQVGPLRRGPSVSAVTFQASFVTDVISFNLGCPLLKKIPFKSHGLVTGRNPLLFGSQNPPAEQIASKQSRPPLPKEGRGAGGLGWDGAPWPAPCSSSLRAQGAPWKPCLPTHHACDPQAPAWLRTMPESKMERKGMQEAGNWLALYPSK